MQRLANFYGDLKNQHTPTKLLSLRSCSPEFPRISVLTTLWYGTCGQTCWVSKIKSFVRAQQTASAKEPSESSKLLACSIDVPYPWRVTRVLLKGWGPLIGWLSAASAATMTRRCQRIRLLYKGGNSQCRARHPREVSCKIARWHLLASVDVFEGNHIGGKVL